MSVFDDYHVKSKNAAAAAKKKEKLEAIESTYTKLYLKKHKRDVCMTFTFGISVFMQSQEDQTRQLQINKNIGDELAYSCKLHHTSLC